jgi:hypothetical protein
LASHSDEPEPAADRWTASPPAAGSENDLGRNGFAMAGVVALTAGVVFMLSLPLPGLPAAAPGLFGIGLAVAFFPVATLAQRRSSALAVFIRGAAMVLLFFATLRLYFFGRPAALELETLTARALLVLAVAANALVAWRSRSAWLVFLAFVLGCASAIIVDAAGYVLVALPLLAAGVVIAARGGGWPVLPVAGTPLIYATYLLWAIGNPLRGGPFQYVGSPALAPWIVLLTAGVFAAGALFRMDREREDGLTNSAALLNCLLGYSVLLVHSAAAFPRSFAALHASACGMFLSVGVLFWHRERSRVSTFLYAMTGCFALSMAIVKLSAAPEVFVWLSLQSVAVVTTAIWLRSRLIVVANFVIYAAIVIVYFFLVQRETGISVGFGLVALASARLLNWQRDRLELRTELMRNAYLVSAFVVFPYALQHLAPARYVALAWICLAVAYYVMTRLWRNNKYRWMGHSTLVLAGLYLILAGSGRITPVHRVASFLALGTVLLLVSLTLRRERPE